MILIASHTPPPHLSHSEPADTAEPCLPQDSEEGVDGVEGTSVKEDTPTSEDAAPTDADVAPAAPTLADPAVKVLCLCISFALFQEGSRSTRQTLALGAFLLTSEAVLMRCLGRSK